MGSGDLRKAGSDENWADRSSESLSLVQLLTALASLVELLTALASLMGESVLGYTDAAEIVRLSSNLGLRGSNPLLK